MAFQAAVYTDVSRDESVDGEDGFNFQSVSEGIAGLERQIIRETMLHKTSAQWPIDRSELEHPQSCAYARVAEQFYFSRGLSTGTTNNGRRGNQLTQAIVTDSVEDLQPYRPAQLYAAQHWQLQKADSKACEQWFAPVEIDSSFEDEALLDALRDDPWMWQTLPTFLTMIADAISGQHKKVILIHDDLDTVMRWIATGSLLIAASDALDLEYRAFVAEPFRSRGQIIGTHPDLLQGPLAGAHVINILEQTVTPIEVTATARKIAEWVERLDSFDALEIVEIAQRWTPDIGEQLALGGAELVTGARTGLPTREAWLLGIQVIEALAEAGLTEDLEMYLDELGDSVASYQLAGEEDFLQSARAARFTMGAELPSLAEAILLPTMTSLLEERELQWAAAWAQELNPSGEWVWPASEDPRQFVLPLTELLLRAPDAALPGLLKLAHPLAEFMQDAELRPAKQRAVALILKQPETAQPNLDGWYGSSSIENALLKGLVAGIEHADPAYSTNYRQQLCAGTWDFLDPSHRADLVPAAAPFVLWLRAAKIARVPIDERAQAIEDSTDSLGKDTWTLALTGTSLPEHITAYVAWLNKVGPNVALATMIVREIDVLLAQDPRNAKQREMQQWLPLAAALAASVPNATDLRDRESRLTEFVESIPSAMERVKEKTGSFMKNFKNKKED